MPWRSCRLLSIAPYRVLPATSGGHWAIVSLHDALGRLCQNHLLGTTDNSPAEEYAFELHRIFPPAPQRYLPGCGLRKAKGIGRRYDVTHIVCEHPYMSPLAMLLSWRLGLPWSLRCHNIEADRFRQLGKWWWRILKLYEGMAMRNANAIFFITPEDSARAMELYELPAEKCHLAPYGTPLTAAPAGHAEAKAQLAQQLRLDPQIPWLYFLGLHSYAPNAEAVRHILDEVHPRLKAAGLRCEILIGGKGLSEALKARIEATEGIRALGFVDDLEVFLNACDVMLNPMLSGGGIKTKAVEALAYKKIVVSTANGAAGLLPGVCGANLLVTPDGDWDAFAAAIQQAVERRPAILQAFYDYYNWEAIARHVLQTLVAVQPRA